MDISPISPPPARAEKPGRTSVEPATLGERTGQLLRHVTNISVIGGGFGWLAGYTYLDDVYRAFGLNFGAVSIGSAEVIGTGYIVTVSGLFSSVPVMLKALGIGAIAGLIVSIFIAFGVRRRSHAALKVRSVDREIRARRADHSAGHSHDQLHLGRHVRGSQCRIARG